MTSREFSNEFDIQYNSIATNSAPALDLYEKSVYLTRAQLEIVKNYFDPNSNMKRVGFEDSIKRRNDLKPLVKSYNSINPTVDELYGISEHSQFFNIPSNVFLIIHEQCVSSDPKICKNKTKLITVKEPEVKDPFGKEFRQNVEISLDDKAILKVVPKTHEEYNIQIDNPFKNLDDKTAWRIDFGTRDPQSTLQNVEIISKYIIYAYRIRYVRYPKPIILTNLNELYPGENLSIDKLRTETLCELHESIHEEILDRAVELALVDYKPDQKMQLKTQMNLRNE